MNDPQLPVNCPYCGARLVYVRTQEGKHLYECLQHGRLILLLDGRLRPALRAEDFEP